MTTRQAATPAAPAAVGVPAIAWRPVLVLTAFYWAVLVAVSARYGFHRDELYFIEAGRHPAWGYPDQPPLLPLLMRAITEVSGESMVAVRVVAASIVAAGVVVAALTARELNGGRTAQLMTAAAYAVSPFILNIGHSLYTVTVDLLATTALIWLLLRWVRTGQAVWALTAGAAAAVALQAKYLVAFVLAAILAGMLIAGPRDLLRRAAPWAAAVVAMIPSIPSLLWQHAHGWPQLGMAEAIGANDDFLGRPGFLPYLVILTGLLTSPLWAYGWVRLFRSPRLHRYRFLGWAYLILVVSFLAAGGKPNYLAGLWAALWAAGAVELESRLAAARWPRPVLPGVYAVAGALAAVMSLPIYPLAWLARSPQATNSATTETVGWPALVAEVARVRDTLPPAERPLVTIMADNYGEAGAIDLYGGRYGLPPAHSGHNGYWHFRVPARDGGPTIFVGPRGAAGRAYLARFWHEVTPAGRIDNGVGLASKEQGRTIWICRGQRAPWRELWPSFAHLGMTGRA
ncbi:glycosyltransferase family 39 protein [Spongiactinospora rosea]|uniref:glycosyltransferase family 39 protein n=1 Tax=Spongiactinospora rosea TaxID=2248750 RepID=UPI0011C01F17|nr:glycosyltransferase family 39 protein [Spongiactinospora rosea]